MLLAGGRTWESLDLRDRIDVAEAAFVEPYAHGASEGVGTYLDNLADSIALASRDPEAVAATQAAQQGQAAAEATFGGPAKKREPAPTVAPS